MFANRRKHHTMTFKVDDYEREIIKDISTMINDKKGEAIRRALWIYYVLYNPRLLLKQALKEEFDLEKPLHENLKPIPILAHTLKLDIELWEATQK